ncbi:MAG: hypothetical protein IJX88_03510 [Clostridia bacterium]|nr:hypothetical protein [Clostridia bacterium]
MSVSAYTPPPNGYRTFFETGKKETEWLGQSFQTEERYREYRECGFDELLIAGEDRYTGEDFIGSKTEQLMNLALKTDLKAIVYDERILSLTVNAKYNIVGELFDTQEALNAFVADCMKDYKEHQAFQGVSIIDEPIYSKQGALEEIAIAIKTACPTATIHTCLLPYMHEHEYCVRSFGEGYEDDFASFSGYLEKLSKPVGYVHYDRYPFNKWYGKYDLTKAHFRVMQEAAWTAQRIHLPFWITGQTYGQAYEDATRPVDEHDLLWQANLFLGFGVRKVYWYTYWRFTTRKNLASEATAVMDDDGTRMIYDEVQRTNAYMQKLAEHVYEYDYEASQLLTKDGKGNEATLCLIEKDLGLFANYRVDAPVLVNKLNKDGNVAYMIMNARDSAEKVVNRVSLAFANETKRLTALCSGDKMEIPVENNRVELCLMPGEAIWILKAE